MAARFADAATLSIPDTIVRNTYIRNFEVIRVATLIMAVPLLILLYGVALTDGLVQRAIRRAGAGHESANI